MRHLSLLLFTACLLQLLLLQLPLQASASLRNDEHLIGWQDFNLNVTDKAIAEKIRNFVESNGLLLATETHGDFPKDVVVPPRKLAIFKKLLADNSVAYSIPQKDVGLMLLHERLNNAPDGFSAKADPATYFAQSSQIYDWIRGIANSHPKFATIQKIGSSYEKRDLLVLKLSSDPAANKPVIFIDAAIHAREWLAPATLNYIIRAFIADRDSGETKALIDRFDWYFMPVVNPDGYDYTFRSSRNRFWRKTRQPYTLTAYGADPNRNFDYQFGGPSTSNNPSSNVYHGPKPFSEPETLALSRFLSSIKDRLVKGMYLSFHTYGMFWLTPPGYTRVNPVDNAEMMRLGNIGRDAIEQTTGGKFKVGQPANVGLYEAAGGSYDWVKYVLGVKYSYTLELRPVTGQGLAGFAAKVSDIPISGSEIYAAVKAVAKALPQK